MPEPLNSLTPNINNNEDQPKEPTSAALQEKQKMKPNLWRQNYTSKFCRHQMPC